MWIINHVEISKDCYDICNLQMIRLYQGKLLLKIFDNGTDVG